MAISSKHKIYGSVLGAGLIALVTDKAFLAPADAAAIDPVVAEYAATEQASVLASARGELVLVAPVANTETNASKFMGQLNRIAEAQDLDLDNIQDAFDPSKAWHTTSDDNVVKTTTIGDGPSSRFLRNHRLLAVMGNGESASVIINDKCLFIGQKIDGFTLVSVVDRVAMLDSNGLRVQLELPGNDMIPSKHN
ncbi:MAG: hypothetical protein IH984_10625 [Planctomycetes bacterium]|nr:hypothetical protein [Planctomycetota bacterium]